MGIVVGIDVAKEFHWVCVADQRSAKVLLSARFENDPPGMDELSATLTRLESEHGQARVGIDVVGGIAGLLMASLAEAGYALVHVPGIAVNRARLGTTGGERKSDPKDAHLIAEQVRVRQDLRALEPSGELDARLRLLVARRRELVRDQTRRIARLRDLLASIHPGLERQVDATCKADLRLLSRYVTPAEIRRAGCERIARFVLAAGRIRTERATALAARALESARAQRLALPGEGTAAAIVRELAHEALATRMRVLELEQEIQDAVVAHPDGALIQSLPGMGATLAGEFIAEAGDIGRYPTPDRLAAAAGLAPISKQSGKVRYLHRPSGGNKALKHTLYQAAFCALQHPESRAYYERKRAEGKLHQQALICLARRRVNVLHAMLRNREPYRTPLARAA